jgi:hypothetical protein
MSDGNDVSLETDRLDQLLEAAAPAPPVVMIQYRDRGIPWWVFVPLLFVVPIVTVVVYHHSVVERYRAQAAEATHFVETWADAVRNANQPVTNPPAALPQMASGEAIASADSTSTVAVTHEASTLPPAAVAPATTVLVSDPVAGQSAGAEGLRAPAGSGAGVTPAETGTTTGSAVPGSTTPSGRSEPAAALVAGVGPTPLGTSPALQKVEVSATTDSDRIAPNDLPRAPTGGTPPPAVGQPPPSRVRSIFPSPFEPENPPLAPTGTPGEPIAPGGALSQPIAPVSEPLPSKEELERQIAEEATRKEVDMADERAGRLAGIRAMRYEARVKFHNELRELLNVHGRDAGKEIDKLARRSSGDYNELAYARAMNVWRHGRMSQRKKVNAIRSLDIPESAILDFMSDNLYPLIRMPGGPRNANELRIRAAKLLLSYELPAAPPAQTLSDAASAVGSIPARLIMPQESSDLRHQ